MNKTELRDAVASAADITGAQADKAVNAVIDSITSALAAGDKVTLPGFGTFETRERSARQGRNPQTGETMEIAASTAPAFKAGAQLKKAVAKS
ncbi:MULTISPECIES: HU family DNA-binding protein [Nocardioides]|uniref:HU family DNA-binding protein n=1 Tax=Nocardioides kribbensis TaxID=305517 RepID=A0ABV1P1R2_9ACTN|nr:MULTISPECIES: HU family DNA-binding protein [Nocardioides]MBJ7527987.1 HU family DNA-binding protein [Nocardioides sp.]MCM3516416.1 HU family DNA-binding protein [Nocardioides sp. P86]